MAVAQIKYVRSDNILYTKCSFKVFDLQSLNRYVSVVPVEPRGFMVLDLRFI